jgi:hypothetical protein
MPTRPSRTSACFRRFAGRESLTFRSTFNAAVRARQWDLRNGQFLPYNSIGLSGGIAVDAFVFEFMGLAMIALCVIVVAVPSQRPPARRISD